MPVPKPIDAHTAISEVIYRLIHATDFLAKLRAQSQWSHSYSLQAIGEYRKFLILALIHQGNVVPCRAVDEVWHLHQTYTQSYRDELCPTLGFPFHRQPRGGTGTSGSSSPQELRALYQVTLNAYGDRFGPPNGLWVKTDSWWDRISEVWSKPKHRKLSMLSIDGTTEDVTFLYAVDTSSYSHPSFGSVPPFYSDGGSAGGDYSSGGHSGGGSDWGGH